MFHNVFQEMVIIIFYSIFNVVIQFIVLLLYRVFLFNYFVIQSTIYYSIYSVVIQFIMFLLPQNTFI